MKETDKRPHTVVKVNDVTKRYKHPPVTAVSNVSLELKSGAIFGLVGESGSGKSTLAKMITGLEKPTSGTIHVDTSYLMDPTRNPKVGPVQMIFQDVYGSLNPFHTTAWTITESLRACHKGFDKRACSERVVDLIERVGLNPAQQFMTRKPSALSGGEKQRIGIARALASSPQVLIADEPTSMLDVTLRKGVLDLLLSIRNEGIAILFITHDLLSAAYICDEIAVMHKGTVIEQGPVFDVLHKSKSSYTQSLVKASPGFELLEQEREQHDV